MLQHAPNSAPFQLSNLPVTTPRQKAGLIIGIVCAVARDSMGGGRWGGRGCHCDGDDGPPVAIRQP